GGRRGRPRELRQRVLRQPARPRTRVRLPVPDVGGQRAELVAQGGSAFRVVDRRLDLAAVPDDALVLQETRHVARPEPGDAIDVEPGKRLAERGALAENRQPAQAGLKAFEADLLEEAAIVGDRRPP